jgi:hypothetical protein
VSVAPDGGHCFCSLSAILAVQVKIDGCLILPDRDFAN